MNNAPMLDHDRLGLTGVRLGIERATELMRSGRLSAADLRVVVEADLERLGVVGHGRDLPEPQHRALLMTTDAVASHLLAALDAAAAGVRVEVVADLLQRAADRLVAVET